MVGYLRMNCRSIVDVEKIKEERLKQSLDNVEFYADKQVLKDAIV
jgi:hypothetical protein